MANNSAAVVWSLTKHVRWSHVLHALAAAVTAAAAAAVAATVVALAVAADAPVAAATVAVLAVAVGDPVAAVVVVTAVVVAATKLIYWGLAPQTKKGLWALFYYPMTLRALLVGASFARATRQGPIKHSVGQQAQQFGHPAHLPGNDAIAVP